MNRESLNKAIVEHLRDGVGSMLDAAGASEPATLHGSAWRVRASTRTAGAVTFTFDDAGARALAAALPGGSDDDAAVKSALAELCGHVVAAAASALGWSGTPDVDAAELVEWSPVEGSEIAAITCAPMAAPLVVAVAVEPVAADAAAATPLPTAPAKAAAPDPPAPERLDVLLDIDLPLVVRFGGTELPLKTLSRLGPGSLIDLARGPDDPVEMLVGERVVARGEVVVVSGSYGIRIVEIVSGRDRVRQFEV